MTDSEKKTHRNSERLVKCPVEGCEAEVLARGVHLHVLRSAEDGHGPQNSVPDNITFDDLEKTGEQEVEMEYPKERSSEGISRFCPYCKRPFQGKEGVMIHLGQVAGRKNHPEDAADRHEPVDFPAVKVDEDENIVAVIDKGEKLPKKQPNQDSLTASDVYRYIATLLAEGKYEEANEARRYLRQDLENVTDE